MDVHAVGISHALREIEQEIDYVAPLDVKVLISGERGVGKHLIARIIHQRSQRAGPFVTINCATSPSVLESKLCGAHGQVRRSGLRRSVLEQAQGGTLFLDHLAEMHPRIQTRLLRLFERSEIDLGESHDAQPLGHVRVISATDYPLLERVITGQFREDLYYRLNIIHIVVPPLRQRPEDVQPLVAHFLDTFSAARHVPPPVLADAALTALADYAWPGNADQLANVMKQLVVCHGVGVIAATDLPTDITHGSGWSGLTDPRTRDGRSMADVRHTRAVEGGQWRWSMAAGRRTARQH